jgi:hypothetical protein
LEEVGECPNDHGGYFIIDGKEKVIIAQERITTNRLFVSKIKDDNTFPVVIEFTCKSANKFVPIIFVYVRLFGIEGKFLYKKKEFTIGSLYNPVYLLLLFVSKYEPVNPINKLSDGLFKPNSIIPSSIVNSSDFNIVVVPFTVIFPDIITSLKTLVVSFFL